MESVAVGQEYESKCRQVEADVEVVVVEEVEVADQLENILQGPALVVQ